MGLLILVVAVASAGALLLPAGGHAISAAPAASCKAQMMARAPAISATPAASCKVQMMARAPAKRAVPKKKATPKRKQAVSKKGPNFQYLNLIPPKNPREEPESIVGLLAQGIEAFADLLASTCDRCRRRVDP